MKTSVIFMALVLLAAGCTSAPAGTDSQQGQGTAAQNTTSESIEQASGVQQDLDSSGADNIDSDLDGVINELG